MSKANGKTGVPMVDEFTVLDSNNAPVLGLVKANFTIKLWNPSNTEVSGTITVSITEIGNGRYKASFTPNAIGTWILTIIHAVYFPYGQDANYEIYEQDVDGLDGKADAAQVDLTFLKNMEGGRWKIDDVANQMIFYKADNVTEVARFDLKDVDGNPSSDDPFERTRV